MERYVKRRKLEVEVFVPPEGGTKRLECASAGAVSNLYKDFWTLLVPHLEWPEVYALTKVARKPRKAALPVLLKVHGEELRLRVLWKMIEYDRRVTPAESNPYHLWYIRGFGGDCLWFETPSHPRLVNNTTVYGLIHHILYKLRRHKELSKVFGQPFLRFARITGIIQRPPLKEWYLLK
jgi:hypothetical protein